MGKGGYLGGSTIIGPGTHWDDSLSDAGRERKVRERADMLAEQRDRIKAANLLARDHAERKKIAQATLDEWRTEAMKAARKAGRPLRKPKR